MLNNDRGGTRVIKTIRVRIRIIQGRESRKR